MGVEVLSSQGIVLVVDMLPNGPAATQGLIRIGDHLLEVDGRDVTHMTYDEILQLVGGPAGSQVMLKFLKSSNSCSDSDINFSYCVNLYRRSLHDNSISGSDSVSFAITSPMQAALEKHASLTATRTSPCKAGGVGLLIRKDSHSQRCYVQSIIEGGSASKDSAICVGDLLLEVDGSDVTPMTIENIVQMISGPEGSRVTLTMASGKDGEAASSVYSVSLIRSSDGYTSYKGGILDAVSRSLMESFISGTH